VDVYRSEAPSENIEEYELVKSNIALDTYSVKDDTLNGLEHGSRKWFYKVKVTPVVGDPFFFPAKYSYVNSESTSKV